LESWILCQTKSQLCPLEEGVLDPVSSTCLPCILPPVFHAHPVDLCSSPPILYLDWNVSLSLVLDSATLTVSALTLDFSLLSPPSFLPPLSLTLPTSRFDIAFSSSFGASLLRSTNSSLTYSLLDIGVRKTISATVRTLPSVSQNTLLTSPNLTVILLAKTESPSLTVVTSLDSLLTPDSQDRVTRALKVAKVAMLSSAPTFLALNAFNINGGTGLIKLFQIIDIFGKFVYIPVTHTVYLSAVLQFVNQLSDLVNIDLDSLLGLRGVGVRENRFEG
jgi:hypothetical protein